MQISKLSPIVPSSWARAQNERYHTLDVTILIPGSETSPSSLDVHFSKQARTQGVRKPLNDLPHHTTRASVRGAPASASVRGCACKMGAGVSGDTGGDNNNKKQNV